MKPAKIIGFFKKGAKKASKSKGKTPASRFTWPSGIKVGIVGHQNSGKTVYFTVLNEECKISKNLQISVTDNATSSEFLTNRRSIWGLGTTSDVGTVVDLRGERNFPESTEKDLILKFNAILDGSRQVSVVGYDYPGKAVSITSSDELKEKVADFISMCDGLIFFYDPKVMGSELESQAQVASFVSMLEKIAPQSKRIPIPVALVINKADVLPGFTGEGQVVMINPEDEHLLSENFELFLNRILASGAVTSDSTWAGTVRNILIKLSDFLKVVVGRTLNFQIFFVSNTGQAPEKIGTEIGRSIYKPPPKIHPIGVKEPFYWILNSILRNRGIAKIRSLAKFIAIISLVWVFFYSIPFLFHFKYQLPEAQRVESDILEANAGKVFSTSGEERRKIRTAYIKYENSKFVSWFFKKFQAPSIKIRQYYQEFDISESIKALDKLIVHLNTVVADSLLWPKLNPSTDSLQLTPDLEKVIADLSEYHSGDETSILYARSDRVLRYWDLFSVYIISHSDSSASNKAIEQVDFDNKTHGNELSSAEKQLGATLSEKLKVIKKVVEKKEVAKKASIELDDLIAEINGNNDPAFRLDDAVKRLRKIKADLADPDGIKMIDRYLDDARKWTKKQKFVYRIETVPQGSHIHVEVTKRGEDATWAEENQIFAGDEYPIEWQINDDIHIAIDELGHECNWGKNPSDKKVLKGKYSLFEMEGNINFDNIGKQISISFKKELIGLLPKLEK